MSDSARKKCNEGDASCKRGRRQRQAAARRHAVRPKGRAVEPQALAEVQALLGRCAARAATS